MTNVSQQLRFACRANPELHFPPGYSGPDAQRQIAEAKMVCNACPVLDACLEWALTNPAMTVDGVTGGTTPAERRALRWSGPISRSSAIPSVDEDSFTTMLVNAFSTTEVAV